MLFARLKTTLQFERMRLRGLSGSPDEFQTVAIAQNLRRMARLASPAAPALARKGRIGTEEPDQTFKPRPGTRAQAKNGPPGKFSSLQAREPQARRSGVR